LAALMAFAGRIALVLALLVCVYGIAAALYGARRGRREWVDSARRSVYCLTLVLTLAMVILEVAFVRNDFSYDTVAATSSSTTPLLYRVAAMWSSQEGSLLLWVWLLSLWSSVAIFITRKRLRDVVPYATSVLLGFGAFFTTLLVFFDSPFDRTLPAPTDGAGLDPLLRNPSMLIHPPMLYSGYTFFAIPFAFAVGALIVRRVDAEWIRVTRRFALASWLFLGIGILLGARWSYYELGWGGYWGWDPVENAALMPWLISTAFLHSVMIQEKRGMLKVWNASLVLGASTLAIVGTFLVRSGVLNSIHAFTGGGLGVPFVTLIAVMAAGSVYLVASRRDVLRSEHRLDSLLSREAAFLLNNVVLVGLCFVILWGTFFPLISQAFTGTSAVVGPPWFDRYTVPLALVLVLLSGIGPMIPWRRATLANARRNLALPLAAAAVMAIAAFTVVPIGSSAPTVVLFCGSIFVCASVGQEFWRGLGARRARASEAPPLALVSMVRRNRRRYGGYIVHVGIAVLFIGVAASSTFQHEQQLNLRVGQSVRVGAYTVKYVKATGGVIDDPKHTGATMTLGALLRVSRDGRYVTTLNTAADYYPASPIEPGQVVADLISGDAVQQIGLDSSFRRDLWAAIKPLGTTLAANGAQLPEAQLVSEADATISPKWPGLTQLAVAERELQAIVKHYLKAPPPASFTLLDSPLVMWIWIGGAIVLLGGLIAIWPPPAALRGRIRARYFARVARDLRRAQELGRA
jgi:cytochrome c-type biogenesis protein CcmF